MPHLNRRTLIAAGLILPTLARPAWAQGDHPVVATTSGPVRGQIEGDVRVFKGLRYGADTGPRRFQPPVAPTRWTAPAEAFAYGPASPQTGSEPNQSEDCLFLNIWSPGLDDARRPVMVYIHGGAYSSGSGSDPLYDGTRLARRNDVVVVTLNHRLGPLGYAYLARLAGAPFQDSGNAGQLDLILALRWVRDNIAGFGGDPGRVMVFGQSGGGAKIATMMATPVAAGLFHRVATMSGQQVTASGPWNATRRATTWLEALGLTPDRAAEAATLPVEALLQATRATDPVLGFGGLYFGPVLDSRSLPRHPFYPDAPAQSAQIPMIIGNTHDETKAFLGGDPANFELTWDDLPGKMTDREFRIDVAPEPVIAAYRRMYPAYSPSDVFFAATTAARSWRGAVIEAEARAASGHPAFVYQLDWTSPIDGGRRGAMHTDDIPLALDNVIATGSRAQGSEAQPMADRLSRAFVALARDGDPNHPGLPTWTPYDLTLRQTMIMDEPARMEDDPRGAERRLFAAVPYVQPGT
ncbi:carboxylesterase [Brevundimonas sp. LM2]|uniref:carboxylesterase/lipase family protein n=1 Tax=Brevundimonas sp. LM2 TaxID=1938605 RepID=UPI00098395CB|nr:carboxylesterase family protein [Brevundimonas sp. LM2]AQR61102.1 carboxylesterase [Brevundimonas sp. LM2]